MINFEITDTHTFNVAKMSGIYVIVNTLTNEFYIGESLDIRKRWEQHIKMLREGTHHNLGLSNSFNKYGEDMFEFKLLQPHFSKNTFLTKAELLILESAYYNKYKNKYKLLNNVDSMNELLLNDLGVVSEIKPEDNIILKKLIINTLLTHKIEWICNMPCLLPEITINDLVKRDKKLTIKQTDKIINSISNSEVADSIEIKSIDYCYKNIRKTSKSIIVKDIESVCQWLKTSTSYKVLDKIELSFGI